MFYFNRFDVSEGIDVKKTSSSKEYDICHYWYFLKSSFEFQPYFCNRCPNLLMMSITLAKLLF